MQSWITLTLAVLNNFISPKKTTISEYSRSLQNGKPFKTYWREIDESAIVLCKQASVSDESKVISFKKQQSCRPTSNDVVFNLAALL